MSVPNSTSNEANQTSNNDSIDSIANLLAGVEPVKTKQVPIKENKKDDGDLENSSDGTSGDDTQTVNELDEELSPNEEEEGINVENDEDITWAKALGVEERNIVLDEEGNFDGIKVKVDGITDVVKLPDLIAGYQTNKNNTNKSKALSEKIKEVDTEKTRIIEDYTTKLNDVEVLTNYLENSFLEEYQAINWDLLRSQNPAEYAALIQDYNTKATQFKSIKNAIDKVRTDELNSLQAITAEQQKELLSKELEKAINDNPEWAKPEVFKKALTSMSEFVANQYGFTHEEFVGIKDARILNLIRDAQKYRAGIKVAEKKIEKPLPKFQKPSGNNQKQVSKLDQLAKRAKNLTGSAKRAAETDAIVELLRNV